MDYTYEVCQISLKAKMFHSEKQISEAVLCYDQAHKLSQVLEDDNVRKTCALNLAAAHLANDDPDKALEYLNEAEPVQKEAMGDLYYNYGLAYERKGQYATKQDERKKLFASAIESFEKASEHFKEYFKMVCLEKCLLIQQQQKNYRQCADLCKKMAEEYEDNKLKKAEKLSDAAAILQTGKLYHDAKRLAKEAYQLLQACQDDTELCDKGNHFSFQNVCLNKLLTRNVTLEKSYLHRVTLWLLRCAYYHSSKQSEDKLLHILNMSGWLTQTTPLFQVIYMELATHDLY